MSQIFAPGQVQASISYFEPNVRGATATLTFAQGTVYVQPFDVPSPITMYRMQFLQQLTTQPQTSFSFSGSVSTTVTSTYSGLWGQSGTVLLLSRQSTGTNANSSNMVTFYSNTFSNQLGMSLLISQTSTNASTATLSGQTGLTFTFMSNINQTGGTTTGTVTSSTTFSHTITTTAQSTASTSTVCTYASLLYSGLRPINVVMNTSLSAGEYWLGYIQSTGSASTNQNLPVVMSLNPGFLYFSTFAATAFAALGATATTGNSNIQYGWGSYSSSGNTTTTFPISNISNQSNYQLWFNMMAQTL
jgi:hypothetical protein